MQRSIRLGGSIRYVPQIGHVLFLSDALFPGCGGYAYSGSAGVEVAGSTDDISYLAGFGTWIDVPPYGSCWQPSVSSDWRPFEYGHWVWTESGWAWVSYEPYGWLVFHYGNWDYRPDIGWFWIEGSDWSPAPVEWRSYDGYCSWAPLPPAGVVWQDPWNNEGARFWIVVRDRDFDRDYIGRYRIRRVPEPRDFGRADEFRRPLRADELQRISGRPVRTVTLNRGPATVYMNPGHPAEHFQSRPGQISQGENPNVQRQRDRGRADGHQVEIQSQGNHQTVNRSAENRSQENRQVQLNRMILPRTEEARVQRYTRQVQRKVLVQRNQGSRSSHRGGNTKNRK